MTANTRVTTMDCLCNEAFELITKMADRPDGLIAGAVPTGFSDLDATAGGMLPGELVVVASRPGVGKTSFSMNVAVNAAKSGARVVVFSAESDFETTALKLVASEARIPLDKLAKGDLSELDWGALQDCGNRLSKLDVVFSSAPSATLDEVREIVEDALDDSRDKRLVVADGLDIFLADKPVADSASRQVDVSRLFKAIARRYEASVLLTREFPGNPKQPKDGLPGVEPASILGALGVAAQVADAVIFLDRSLGAREEELSWRPPYGLAEVNLVKHRRAPIRSIKLAFVPEFRRFMNYAEDDCW